MKGSIGTSLEGKMIYVKERKLSKKEKKRLGRVKPRKHRIKKEYPALDKVSELKRVRLDRQKLIKDGRLQMGDTGKASSIRSSFGMVPSRT